MQSIEEKIKQLTTLDINAGEQITGITKLQAKYLILCMEIAARTYPTILESVPYYKLTGALK